MSITYTRWKLGEDRRSPKDQFHPLPADHPLVGDRCLTCFDFLKEGQVPALFSVGPDSPEAAAHHDAGEWFSCLAVPAHETCLWGEPDDQTGVTP